MGADQNKTMSRTGCTLMLCIQPACSNILWKTCRPSGILSNNLCVPTLQLFYYILKIKGRVRLALGGLLQYVNFPLWLP